LLIASFINYLQGIRGHIPPNPLGYSKANHYRPERRPDIRADTEKKKENDPPINQISCSTFYLNVGLKAYASVTPSFILSYTHLNPSVVTDS